MPVLSNSDFLDQQFYDTANGNDELSYIQMVQLYVWRN